MESWIDMVTFDVTVNLVEEQIVHLCIKWMNQLANEWELIY